MAVGTLSVTNDFEQLSIVEDEPGHVTTVRRTIDLIPVNVDIGGAAAAGVVGFDFLEHWLENARLETR